MKKLELQSVKISRIRWLGHVVEDEALATSFFDSRPLGEQRKQRRARMQRKDQLAASQKIEAKFCVLGPDRPTAVMPKKKRSGRTFWKTLSTNAFVNALNISDSASSRKCYRKSLNKDLAYCLTKAGQCRQLEIGRKKCCDFFPQFLFSSDLIKNP